MALDDLVATIETIKTRIAEHREALAANETRTRQVLIDPLLVALGWDVTDPSQVQLEYDVRGKRADYALIVDQTPVAVIEAKRLGVVLVDDNTLQVMNYANTAGIDYMVVTNGDQWNMYSVFKRGAIEDRVVMELKIQEWSAHSNALKSLSMWKPNLGTGAPPSSAHEPVLVNASKNNRTESQRQPVKPESNVVVRRTVGNDWYSLANDSLPINFSKSTKLSKLKIADQEYEVSKWTDFTHLIGKWLVESGHLHPHDCPVIVTRSTKKCSVNVVPEHPDGTAFRSSKALPNGMWIETYRSAKQHFDLSCRLLQKLGLDPDTVKIRFT